MKPILLVDFGSTNTKVTAADVDECRILGTATAYTTVETDINEGLGNALKILEKTTGPWNMPSGTPVPVRRED